MNLRWWAPAIIVLGAVACNSNITTSTSHVVGGTVTGLSGTLVLANNVADHLTIAASGAFQFDKPVQSGGTYAVTVLNQPVAQTCTITNGIGVIASTDITNIHVSCVSTGAQTFSVGGTVTGFDGATGSLTLANGADEVSVVSSGPFAFAALVAPGTAYNVQVSASPAGWNCTVSQGTGQVADANITSVAVTCSRPQYNVSGTISGAGGPFVIANNGNTVNISANQTSFTISGLHQGDAYSITVPNPPTGQTCSVSSGSGTIDATSITGVTIACAVVSYQVAGTISGADSQFVIGNGASTQVVGSGQTTFSFGGLHEGDSYNIVVTTQPTGQSCSFSGTSASGNIAAANVTGIVLTCATVPTFSVSGTINGATGSTTIANNGGSSQVIAQGTTAFTFGGVEQSSAYAITVTSPPPGQYCTVSNSSGTVQNSNVTNVAIACQSAAVSGTITGVTDNLVLQAQNGGASQLLGFSANANSFSVGGYIPGDTYNISVYASSVGSSCTLGSNPPASGTIATTGNPNVTGITVACVPFTNYMVSGAVFGSSGALTISIGGTQQTIPSTQEYFYQGGFANNTNVTVSIVSTSNSQTCAVNPNSTVTIADAGVAGVIITCQ